MVLHADTEGEVAHVALCCVSPVDNTTCHCVDSGLAFYGSMYNMFATLKLLVLVRIEGNVSNQLFCN